MAVRRSWYLLMTFDQQRLSTAPVFEYVATRLAMRRRKYEIRDELEALLGRKISARSLEHLVNQGHILLRLRAGRSTGEFRNEALGFYEEVIRSEESSFSEKTRAQERIDAILGLENKRGPGPDASSLTMAQRITAAMREMDGLPSIDDSDAEPNEGGEDGTSGPVDAPDGPLELD